MSKLDASTASVAALVAADGKYDDADDDDDDRKLSPLAPGGMMTERGDNNIVPAQRANAAFASPSSVEGDEDASPAASASSSSTGGESSRRGRGSTISTVASASTTIGGSGGGTGGGNATVLIQHIDTHMSLPRSGGSGTVGEANGATVPPSMMDRVKKQLRKATFVTPATPTGETRRLAHKAFTGLIKKDEVYCAIVEHADDEEESQGISAMCISHADMEGKSSFTPAPPANPVSVDFTTSSALTAFATSAVTALNAFIYQENMRYDGHLKPATLPSLSSIGTQYNHPPQLEKRKSPLRGEKLSYINISDGAIAVETIDSPTKKLKSCTKAKSAVGDVIEIESSEDERDDSRKEKADGDVTENKLFLVYPFEFDEELLRKASRGLLELGGDSLGVVPILDNQPDEDVTRDTFRLVGTTRH
jgi:hypothetical protein